MFSSSIIIPVKSFELTLKAFTLVQAEVGGGGDGSQV